MERRTAEEARRFAKIVKSKYATGTYTYSSLSRELDCSVQYVRNIILGKKVVRRKPPEGNRKRLVVYGVAFYVYDDGRIWSCALNKFKRAPKEGYHKFKVIRGEVGHVVTAHRLVLTAHNRPPKKGEVARHLDDDPTNNHISNLAWGTAQDNSDDMVRNGGVLRGEDVPCAKLTDVLVTKLRQGYNPKCSTELYLEEFIRHHGIDIHVVNLRLALFSKRWTHIPTYGVVEPERKIPRPVLESDSKFVQKADDTLARRVHRNWIKFAKRYPSRAAFCRAYRDHLAETTGLSVHKDTIDNIIRGKSFPHIYEEFHKR